MRKWGFPVHPTCETVRRRSARSLLLIRGPELIPSGMKVHVNKKPREYVSWRDADDKNDHDDDGDGDVDVDVV